VTEVLGIGNSVNSVPSHRVLSDYENGSLPFYKPVTAITNNVISSCSLDQYENTKF